MNSKSIFKSGWFSCFLVTFILYALQKMDGPGLLLSFLSAELWSILFINLGFILMGWRAYSQAGPRWMKVVPAVWFGGYFVVALISHLFAYQFYRQIDAWNAEQKIQWDRNSDIVALAHSWSDENRAVVFSAKGLIENYGIDQALDGAAYQNSDSSSTYRRLSLVQEGCGMRGSQAQTNWSFITRGGLHQPFQRAANLCLLSRTEYPSSRVISFVNGGITKTDLILDREVEEITVSVSDTVTYHLKAAWTQPLTWFPQPILGCIRPGFSPASWCGFKFGRENAREAGRTPEKVITSALGLSPVTLESRFPNLRWEESPSIIPRSRGGS
ncbi:hypothetical protein NUH86_18370 [Sphingobium sp. JS3065]|uniref:hypothetical protein n=1 Tax=Sphingobium sp. JS3065 TaxID=2970925 RepID=UPI002264B07F|nr:hypothetical protein [Sphingobium sp. JS3065]UZW57548.1 hypothetical protein NUH86_18370 [Sphingobium sp. JS3065]